MAALALLLPALVNAQWNKTADGPYAGREGSMAVYTNGSLILVGGRDDFTFYNDVWRSDDDGVTWRQIVPAAAFGQRSYHTLTVFRGCLVLTSGQSFTHFYNDVWRSCDLGLTWDNISPDGRSDGSIFSPRAGATAAVAPDGRLVVAAGSVEVLVIVDRKFFGDVWASVDGRFWTQETSAAPWKARSGPRLVLVEGTDTTGKTREELFLVAGEVGFTQDTQLGDIWRTDGSLSSWVQVSASSPWSARSGHGVYAIPAKGAAPDAAPRRIAVVAGWPLLFDVWVCDDPYAAAPAWRALQSAWQCADGNTCGRFDFAFANDGARVWTLAGSRAVTTFGTMSAETWLWNSASI